MMIIISTNENLGPDFLRCTMFLEENNGLGGSGAQYARGRGVFGHQINHVSYLDSSANGAFMSNELALLDLLVQNFNCICGFCVVLFVAAND